ncbi:MAG: hypothetical protein AB1468_05955, partial [Candidatus Micrarchaeota archaeon]
VDFEFTPFPYQPLNFTFNYSGVSEPIPGCSPNYTNASGIATCTIPESMGERVAGCVFITVEYNSTNPRTMGTAATTQYCRGFVPINFGSAWACLPFFIILGLLAASMYAIGRSPVTGFDIFSPRLPMAKKHGFKGEDRRTAWMTMQVAYRRNLGLAERTLRETRKKIAQKMKADRLITEQELIQIRKASMSDIEGIALKNRAIPKKLEQMTNEELRKTLKELEVKWLEKPIPIFDERNRTRLLSVLRKELRARYQEHFEFQYLRDRAFAANRQGYEKYFNSMEHTLGMLEANRAAMRRLADAYGETDVARIVGKVPLVGGVFGGVLKKTFGRAYEYGIPFRAARYVQSNVGTIFTERTRNLTQAGKLVWGVVRAGFREPAVGVVQLVEERRRGKLGPKMEKFAKFVKKKSGDTYDLGPLVPKFDEEARRLAESEPSIIWGKRGPKSNFDTEEDARKGVINLWREFRNREEEIRLMEELRGILRRNRADVARPAKRDIENAGREIAEYFKRMGDVRHPDWRFGQYTQKLPATEREYWLMALGVLVSRSQTGEGKRETGEVLVWRDKIEKKLHRGIALGEVEVTTFRDLLEKMLLTSERDRMNAELEIQAWKKIRGRLLEKYGVEIRAGDAITLELMRRADADFLSPREKTRYIPRNVDWFKEMKENEMDDNMVRRIAFERNIVGSVEEAYGADINELKRRLLAAAPGMMHREDERGIHIYKDMFMAMEHDKFLTRMDKEKTKKGLW